MSRHLRVVILYLHDGFVISLCLKGNTVVSPEHTVLLNVCAQENVRNQSELCNSETECVRTYACLYVCMYVRTYINTCIHAYIHAFLHTYIIIPIAVVTNWH
jgi:hypothetical protein